MQEIVSCPSCQRKLQVPDTLLGQDVQCPTCGATFVAATGGKTGPSPPPTQPGRELVPREERRYRDEDDEDDDRPRRRRRDLTPHRGAMLLVFGILSIVACPIFGPISWVMGNSDMSEIQAGRMDPEGEGLTQAGRVCGIIGTVILVLYILGMCLWFLMVVGLIATAR